MSALLKGFSFNSVIGRVEPFSGVADRFDTKFFGFSLAHIDVIDVVHTTVPNTSELLGFGHNIVLIPVVIQHVDNATEFTGFAFNEVSGREISGLISYIDAQSEFFGMSMGHISTPFTYSFSAAPTELFGFTFNDAVSGAPRTIPDRYEPIHTLFDMQFENDIILCWEHGVQEKTIDWIVRLDINTNNFEVLNKQRGFEFLASAYGNGSPPSGATYDFPPANAFTYSLPVSGFTIALSAFDGLSNIQHISDAWRGNTRYDYFIRSYYVGTEETFISGWKQFGANMLHVDFTPDTINQFSKVLWNFEHRTPFPP